jgi:hypothetical protein
MGRRGPHGVGLGAMADDEDSSSSSSSSSQSRSRRRTVSTDGSEGPLKSPTARAAHGATHPGGQGPVTVRKAMPSAAGGKSSVNRPTSTLSSHSPGWRGGRWMGKRSSIFWWQRFITHPSQHAILMLAWASGILYPSPVPPRETAAAAAAAAGAAWARRATNLTVRRRRLRVAR